MNNITPETIRTYVKKLAQKGYDSDVIVNKIQSVFQYLQWAYHQDVLPYNQYQQIKDEIDNIEREYQSDSHSEAHISPLIQDFESAQYMGEKKTDGMAGEFYFKFRIETYKIKSWLKGILKRVPLLGPLIPNEKNIHDQNNKITSSNSKISFEPQYLLGIAFVLIIMAILGAGIYQRFFQQTSSSLAYPSTPVTGGRILSFQGRLTDSLGNPITTATNMRFRLYSASSGGTTFYDTGTCSITPDQDGVHNVLIGSDCGSEIASSVFTENSQIWLGVLVGSDSEATPRQRIANVPYAINAETLQGLPLGTAASNVAYIDQGGDLLIGAASPQVGSTYASQTFLLSSANAITLQSAGSGDVTLTATESGTIKFATGGSQHGLITNGGLFGFGTTGPDAKLDVLYTGGEQLRLTYADGSSYAGFTTSSGGDLTIDVSGGDLILANADVLNIGGNADDVAFNAIGDDTANAGNVNSDNDLYIEDDLEVDGTIFGNVSGTFSTGFTQGSVVFADGSGNLAQDNASLFFDDTNNKLGIGTASPTGKLTVTGAAVGKALAIFNETGDQNILTASASGTTVANLDRSGNLAIEGALSDLGGATLAVNDNLDVSGTLTSGTADAFTVNATGNITTSGTTGLTFSSTGGIVLAGGTLSDGTDGVDIADNLEVTGDTTLTGDLAVNGDDITSDGTTFNLSIGNAGTINFKDGSNTLVVIKDQGVYPFLNLAAKTDTGDPASCAEGDIYYNDTDDTIKICHESNTWEALDGGAGSSAWDDITDPTDNLSLTMAAYNSTLTWDPGADATETALTLNFDGEDSSTDQDQILLALNQSSNGTDVTEAADALLTFANSDANDPVENAIRFDAGAAGTDFTYGINFDSASIGTAELVLQNGETIDNVVDGTIALTGAADISGTLTSGTADAFTVNATGNITTSGTTGLTFSSTGGIVLTGGTISDGTDGVDIADNLEVTGDTTLTGDLAVNGDDITSDGDLTINPAGGQVLLADTDTLNIGGVTGLAYNAISDSGTTSHSLASDDDLYVEGDVEVDGTLYADGAITAVGTVTAGDFACTDCLDFAEFEDTLDLDAALVLNQATNTWTQNFTGTTTTGYTYNADSLTTGIAQLTSIDALTTGTGISVSSTSTALGASVLGGSLANLDWTPGSTTTAATDLVRINIGANGNVTNLLNVTDAGSSLFRVAETGIETTVPASFTAAGDTSFAYDILLTNQTSSNIKSNAPLYIQAGETFESNDLTLQSYNAGDVLLDAGSGGTGNGSVGFYDSNVKAASVTTPIEFSDSATDINTYRTNFTDETIVGAINEAYSAAVGGAGGLWTDGGTTTYLTATTDELVLGGSAALSSAKFSIDGDADQIQLIVQGNGTQTTSLAVFENSAGTDQFTISNTGDLVATGDLAVNGGDFTTSASTFNLLNATATTLNIGGAATTVELGAATGTTSINNALTVDGNTTLGNASGDTVTANADAWTFANDTNFALSGGVNGLSFDTNTLSIDGASDLVGIGTTSPVGKLHVTGAVTGKALTILNETGNQDLLTASSSGVTKFTINNSGKVTTIGGLVSPWTNTVIVDANGKGDYTTISGAIAGVSPTSSNPVRILVMPGAYTDSTVTLKTYLIIQGSGQDKTKWTVGNTGASNNMTGGDTTTIIKDLQFEGIAGTFGTVTSVAINWDNVKMTDAGAGVQLVKSTGSIVRNSTVQTDYITATIQDSRVTGTELDGSIIYNSYISGGVGNGTGWIAYNSTFDGYEEGVYATNTCYNCYLKNIVQEFGWYGFTIFNSVVENVTCGDPSYNYTGTCVNATNSHIKAVTFDDQGSGAALSVTLNNSTIGTITVTGGSTQLVSTGSSQKYSSIAQSPAADKKVLQFRAAASQTANITDWQNSSGTALTWIDESGNVRIGSSAADTGKLNVTGADTGKALAIFNETGDQAILTASASGTTVMTLGRTGNLSLTDSSSSNIDFNLSSTGDFTISDAGTPFATFTDAGVFTLDSLNLDGTTIGLTTDTDLLSLASAVLTVNGDLRLADTSTLEVGGLTAVAYNALANSGEAPEEAAIAADNDLYIGGDLEVDGTIYGNVSGTISPGFTQGSVIFTGASGNLAQDNSSFFFDDTSNLLGIGTASPVGKLHVTGAVTGKALAIFNETGDQDILVASASGTTRFRIANDGAVYAGYLADISNTAYGIDPAGTSNFGGYSLKVTGGALLAADSGNVGIGDQGPDAKLNILATTEQLRLDYDDSNYSSFTVSSGGDLTIAPSGSDLAITGNVDISGTLTSGTANAFTVNATGNITTSGTTGLTFSSTGGIVLAGGTLSDGTDGVDIADDLEISGGTTLGDASGDTVTANAAAWTFANDTTVALSGGVNGINFDSNTLSIDATNNRIGIGTAAPTAWFEVYDTTVGNTLAVFSNGATDALTPLRIESVDNGGIAEPILETSAALRISSTIGGTTNHFRLLPLSGDIWFQNTNSSGTTYFSGNNGADTTAVEFKSSNTTFTGDLAVNGDDITSDSNLTLAATGYVRVGDSGTPGSASGDDDLYVLSDIELDGTLYADGAIDANGQVDLGDGGDTLTLNGTTVSITNTGAGNDITINAVDQIVLTDFTGGGSGCTALETDGSGNLTCGSDAGGNTAWDDIGDPDAAGAIAFAEYAQTMDWDLATDVAKTALSLTFTNDVAGSNTQYLLNLDNLNDGGSNGVTESLLVLDNSDTNEAVTDGILFVNAGGGFTDYIDTPSSVFKVDGSGNITGVAATLTGDLAVNGDDITSDENLTINATGYVKIGDSGSPSLADSDDDLYVQGKLEVDGVFSLENDGEIVGNLDVGSASTTATFNTDDVVFSTDTNVTLSGGVNGLAFDTSTLSIDATNDRIGIGTTAPDAKLQVTGASTGKALTILNETGDQNVFVASVSGSMVFGITNNGDVTRGDKHGINSLPDQGSLAPNASFEVQSDSLGLPDAWSIKAGSASVSSDSKHGSTAILMTATNDEIYSTCFPIASEGSRTYTMSGWFKTNTGTAGTVRAGLYTYSSKANCTADSSASQLQIVSATSLTTTYSTRSGTGSPTNGHIWARAYVKTDDAAGDDLYADGIRLSQSNLTAGLDLAETYPANLADNLQPAEIVALGTNTIQNHADVKNIVRSSRPYDNNAFGVITTKPGLILDNDETYEKVEVALKGRVPVLVTTENGPINIGDPITASSKPGIGMKATHSGRIIGYAMTEHHSKNKDSVEAVIVFVNPETYIDLSILTNIPQNLHEKLQNLSKDIKDLSEKLINQEARLAQLESLATDAKEVITEDSKAVVTAFSATIDTLIVDRIVGRNIEAEKITTKTLEADSLTAQDATISGTLVADNIDSENIREFRKRLEAAVEKDQKDEGISKQQVETMNALNDKVHTIEQYIDDIKNEEIVDEKLYQNVLDTIPVDPGSQESEDGQLINPINFENILVTGEAGFYTATVTENFTAGNIFIRNNEILALNNDLNLNALEKVNILDGAVIVERSGKMIVKGEIIAKGGITIENSGLRVINETQEEVATIDASGSARFSDISLDQYTEATHSGAIIASVQNYKETGIFAPAIRTNAASTGNGIVPANNNDIVIFNDNITPTSLVYITATSSTNNHQLYVAEKKTCENEENNCSPYFKVALDDDIEQDVTFNWWIVN